MKKVLGKPLNTFAVGVVAILLLCGMMPLCTGCDDKVLAGESIPIEETIRYTYVLRGQELYDLQQRFNSADEATKEEMYVEIGLLLGLSDQYGKVDNFGVRRAIDKDMQNALEVWVSVQYIKSDIYGNITYITKEEALGEAVAINAAMEAMFQEQLAKLLSK